MHLFRGKGSHRTQRDTQPGKTQVLPETLWGDEEQPSGVPPEESVVITISRQFGSGGAEIGRIVAREMGLHYVDHEIIDEVARRLGITTQQADRQDEYTAGNVGYILGALHGSNPFSLHYSSLFSPSLVPTQSQELAYFRLTQKVILEMASRGNAVIVGRGSQFLLHSSPRTLHIYIFAPHPYRLENVMERFHLNRTQAEQLIEQRDFQHNTYLLHHYGSDGHQPGFYHLLINTGLFPFELAASFIQQALPVVKKID